MASEKTPNATQQTLFGMPIVYSDNLPIADVGAIIIGIYCPKCGLPTPIEQKVCYHPTISIVNREDES